MKSPRLLLLGLALLCFGGFAAWLAYLFDRPVPDPLENDPHAAHAEVR